MSEQEVEKVARKIISDFLRVEEKEVELTTHIANDLGADSLALVELGFLLSESFGVRINNDDEKLLVFGEMVKFLSEKRKSLMSSTSKTENA